MRVGCVSYATRQGIALIMRSFYRAGIVTDPIVQGHSRPSFAAEWYPLGTPQNHRRRIDGPEIDEWVRRIDLALFIETCFDWSLADRVRAAGKPTVLIPMHEWFPRRPEHKFDLMACPSALDLDYFAVDGPAYDVGEVYNGKPEFCDKAVFLPVPIDEEVAATWKPRTRARRWLHSCGNVGYKFHKGTDLVFAAAPLVKHPDWRLTVRAQDDHALRQAMAKARWTGDPRVTVTTEDVPRANLYDDHDVLLAPERFNGLSLPLQEARAAGLLVCTTDRFPANTWLPCRLEEVCYCGLGPEDHKYPGAAEHNYVPRLDTDCLIPVQSKFRTAISDNWQEFDECVVDPAAIAARIDALFNADVAAYSEGGREWARTMSWETLKPVWTRTLQELVNRCTPRSS